MRNVNNLAISPPPPPHHHHHHHHHHHRRRRRRRHHHHHANSRTIIPNHLILEAVIRLWGYITVANNWINVALFSEALIDILSGHPFVSVCPTVYLNTCG